MLKEAQNFIDEFLRFIGVEDEELKNALTQRFQRIKVKINYTYDSIVANTYKETILISKKREYDKLLDILTHEFLHIVNNIKQRRNFHTNEFVGEYDKSTFSEMPIEYIQYFLASQEPEKFLYITKDNSGKTQDISLLSNHFIEYAAEYYTIQMRKAIIPISYVGFSDGVYAANNFMGGSYDFGVNIIGMLEPLIGKKELLDVYTGKKSFCEIINDFDDKYGECLEMDEKQNFKYPFLKIFSDMQMVFNEKEGGSKYLFECTETIFKAYLIKLNKSQLSTPEQIKELFDEIKQLQKLMPQSINTNDISMVMDLMHIIEEKFINKAQNCENTQELEKMKADIKFSNEIPDKKLDSIKNILDSVKKTDNIGFREKLYKALYFSSKINNGIYNDILRNDTETNEIADKINSCEEKDSIEIYKLICNLANRNFDEKIKNGQESAISLKKYSDLKKTLNQIEDNMPVLKEKEKCENEINGIKQNFNQKLSLFQKYMLACQKKLIRNNTSVGRNNFIEKLKRMHKEDRDTLKSLFFKIEEIEIVDE